MYYEAAKSTGQALNGSHEKTPIATVANWLIMPASANEKFAERLEKTNRWPDQIHGAVKFGKTGV